MLMTEKTYEKFGYRLENLSKGSHKEICVCCDYCKENYITTMKRINLGYKVIKKDACWNCRFKKREEVSLKRDGVRNSAQRPEIRKKISENNIERLQSEEYKDKIKKTMLEKYGAKSAMHVKAFRDKQKKALKDKHGVENPMYIPGVAKEAAIKSKKTKLSRGIWKLYDGKTLPQIAKDIGFSRSHFGKLVRKHGLDKALSMTPQESGLETTFREWLIEQDISYERQFFVNGKFADFKINNLLVELDGLYWHSEYGGCDRNYHINKRNIYLNNGFDCMFFRENEIVNKFDIMTSIILNRLNHTNNIYYARKCTLERDTDKEFFNQNHLMGKGYGSTFSLFFNGEIVASIQIRRLNKKNYEIARFCCKNHTRVIGAFSRLLKFVERELEMDSLKTFIDLRYGYGKYLEQFGFKRGVSHLSFKWTNGHDIVHRLKFPGNTGYEKGFSKIWDCGQLPLIKRYMV